MSPTELLRHWIFSSDSAALPSIALFACASTLVSMTRSARRPGRPGRPRLKGRRLPSLQDGLSNRKTRWTKLIVQNWYGCTERTMEFCSGTAIWYHDELPPVSIRWVLIRDPKESFDPLALLSTEPTLTPQEIVTAYIRGWRIEVTFKESRAHLGIETRRQWSDKAIARSTPVLLALFSVVTLMASRLATETRLPILQSSWYRKSQPTFSDALAAVRKHLWGRSDFFMSGFKGNRDKISSQLFERFCEALCYAA